MSAPIDTFDEKVQAIIDLRALLMHEVTHFLDMTTTLWGLEYTCRKSRVLRQISQQEEYNRELDVFKLNTAEIEVHHALLMRDEISLKNCTVTHTISINEDFGPVLTVSYHRNGKECHRIPISMLTVFEGHATANETIRKIKDLGRLSRIECRIATDLMHEEFNNHLNDPSLTEYTCLLYLIRVHFEEELTLLEMLTLFSEIVRFTLNLSSIDMSRLANKIGFAPTKAGATLAQDMRRGASRQIICFKTILFLYGWVKTAKANIQIKRLEMLRNQPKTAIYRCWEALGVNNLFNRSIKLEQEVYLSNLRENISIYPDYTVIIQSLCHNANKLDKKPAGAWDFSDLKLLNPLLTEDLSEVFVPNSINPTALHLFDHFDHVIASLRAAHRTSAPKKFFMPYDAIPVFIR